MKDQEAKSALHNAALLIKERIENAQNHLDDGTDSEDVISIIKGRLLLLQAHDARILKEQRSSIEKKLIKFVGDLDTIYKKDIKYFFAQLEKESEG